MSSPAPLDPTNRPTEIDAVLTDAPLVARTLDDVMADVEAGATSGKTVDPEKIEYDRTAAQALSALFLAVERADRAVQPLYTSQVENEPSLERLSAELARATQTMEATARLAEAVNVVGDPKNPRSPDAGAHLIYPAALSVKKRSEAKSIPAPLPGELRLYNCLVWSRSPSAQPATWQRVGSAVFDLIGKSDNLPGPDKYLAIAAATPDVARPLLAQYLGVLDEIREVKQKREGKSIEILQGLQQQKSLLEEKLDKFLTKLNYADPYQIPEVGQTAAVKVGAKREVMSALTETYRGLETLIERAVLNSKENTDSPAAQLALKIPELIEVPREKGGSGVRFQVKEVHIPASFKHPVDGKVIANFLECFLATRQAIEAFYPGIPRPQRGPDPELTSFREGIERTLGPLFGGRSERSAEVIDAISRVEDPRMPELLGRLISTRILLSKQEHFELPLSKPENFQLFALGTALLVSGAESLRGSLEGAFSSGQLSATVDFANKIRAAVATKKVAHVARVIDDELDRLSKDSGATFATRATLMATLRALVDIPEVRTGLKGRLKNLKSLSELTTLIQKGIPGEKTNAAKAVERMRSEISRKLLPDLSDYRGQKALVAEVRELFTSNLRLLASPSVWSTVPAHYVIINGILVHGGPGAGKTFLAKCISNEYGLPLITVTREEMATAFQRASEAADRSEKGKDRTRPGEEPRGNEIETALAEFMERKIRQASAEMEKSGALASIVFIDEMEAEFQNRDPRTSDRADITRTNIMLRVIERLIEEHPKVFFLSATNHFDQVDSAGLRYGRYGVHFNVALPTQEDVEDLLKGILSQVDLSLTPEQLQTEGYKELVKAAVGVPPKLTTVGVHNKIALLRLDQTADEIVLDSETLSQIAKRVRFLTEHDHRGKKFENIKVGGSSESTEPA